LNGNAGLQATFRKLATSETVPLRHEVLWPNHPVSHVLLPEDEQGHHYGAFIKDSEIPVAVISVFSEPLPQSLDHGVQSVAEQAPIFPAVRFRKFACRSDMQGLGIGSALLALVRVVAREELGAVVLWCDARLDTRAWYERRGMTAFGSTFAKSGVDYVRMKVEL
jgi:GNAT superfamily N-acetyltransferase